MDEIRQEIINEETGDTETPQSRRKMEKLEALDKVKLTSTIMNVVRPRSLSEIVGQDRAVKALFSRIASPYPSTSSSMDRREWERPPLPGWCWTKQRNFLTPPSGKMRPL